MCSAYSHIQLSGIAGAGGKGRIPWARMKGNEEDYILPEYLPEGIPFSQFHHMHLEDLNSLLQHWTQRQAAGDIPFRFKKLDRLGKRELAADNTPTGVGPGDQSESEPQDAREDQEQEGVSGGQGDPGSSAKEAPDRQGQDTNGVRFLQLSWSAYAYRFWYNPSVRNLAIIAVQATKGLVKLLQRPKLQGYLLAICPTVQTQHLGFLSSSPLLTTK